jgi:hypothetical protein
LIEAVEQKLLSHADEFWYPEGSELIFLVEVAFKAVRK